jgi:hypothetical protein
MFCSALIMWAGACAAPRQKPPAIRLSDIPFVEHLDHRNLKGTVSADTAFGRVVATSKYRRYDHGRDGGIHYWAGMDGETPAFILQEITLWIEGTQIPVPRESYARCGESYFQSSSLQFFTVGGKLGLCYSGGDGAGAHRLLYILDGRRISECLTENWMAVPGKPYPEKTWQSVKFP